MRVRIECDEELLPLIQEQIARNPELIAALEGAVGRAALLVLGDGRRLLLHVRLLCGVLEIWQEPIGLPSEDRRELDRVLLDSWLRYYEYERLIAEGNPHARDYERYGWRPKLARELTEDERSALWFEIQRERLAKFGELKMRAGAA